MFTGKSLEPLQIVKWSEGVHHKGCLVVPVQTAKSHRLYRVYLPDGEVIKGEASEEQEPILEGIRYIDSHQVWGMIDPILKQAQRTGVITQNEYINLIDSI